MEREVRTDLMIVSPMFFSDGSGASVYYRLLARSLIGVGYSVAVVSDKERGDFEGKYYAVFPKRCGLNRNRIRDGLLYVIQNLNYSLIARYVAKERPCSVLIHSSFYNMPGLFPEVLRNIRREGYSGSLVIDVRDRLARPNRVKEFDLFDQVIACSENVEEFLEYCGVDRRKIVRIPVIQEKIKIDEAEAKRFRCRLGLFSRRYILYAGLIKETKNIELLIESFVEHVRKTIPDIVLVIAGLIKTSNSRLLRMLRAPGVVYAGNYGHVEVLQLMSGAALCANLSPNEGMPRFCLEGIELGKPSILPPNVPEFNRHCKDFVAECTEAKGVGNKMMEILRSGRVPNYPISKHYCEEALPRYVDTLRLPRRDRFQ